MIHLQISILVSHWTHGCKLNAASAVSTAQLLVVENFRLRAHHDAFIINRMFRTDVEESTVDAEEIKIWLGLIGRCSWRGCWTGKSAMVLSLVILVMISLLKLIASYSISAVANIHLCCFVWMQRKESFVHNTQLIRFTLPKLLNSLNFAIHSYPAL